MTDDGHPPARELLPFDDAWLEAVSETEYRIVAVVNFTRQAILLKWVGLHKDYDRIDAATI